MNHLAFLEGYMTKKATDLANPATVGKGTKIDWSKYKNLEGFKKQNKALYDTVMSNVDKPLPGTEEQATQMIRDKAVADDDRLSRAYGMKPLSEVKTKPEKPPFKLVWN